MQNIRRALFHLALAALILRGLLPAGWMPNVSGAGDASFVICTLDGPVTQGDAKAPVGKDDPRAHEACPFAAAAHLAPPVNAFAFAAPEFLAYAAPRVFSSDLAAQHVSFLRPASRAPPFPT